MTHETGGREGGIIAKKIYQLKGFAAATVDFGLGRYVDSALHCYHLCIGLQALVYLSQQSDTQLFTR